MNLNIEIQALTKMKKAKGGALFFVEDFLRFGNAKAIAKALERLVQKGDITRVARGMYARPEVDPVIGSVMPGLESIARAVARRDKARIIPTGVYALHALGLSTQIPLNVVYLTDGTARKIKVGNRSIVFKKTSPKNLAVKSEICSLVIQALKTIGKDKLTEDEKSKFLKLLKMEKPGSLEHDLRLAPEWIRKIMKEALTSGMN